MKRMIAVSLILSLLLCGCGGGNTEPTQPHLDDMPAATQATAATEPVTEATEEPTTEPTEPKVYFNPLNGEILDAPFDQRLWASTVANTPDAIPHVNIHKADMVFESFVNNSVVRCLALFSDPSDVEAIGSTRSTRLMFNNICQHYNAILSHGGGSAYCLEDATARGLDHYNVDSLMRSGNDPLKAGTAYRDKDHPQIKYGDANLYAIGPGVMAYAESQGVQTSGLPEHDYGFRFQENVVPVDGEDAGTISIKITFDDMWKETKMVYNPETGKYVWHQWGKVMKELFTGEEESFNNVIVMLTTMDDVKYKGARYQRAYFEEGGLGYFACNGKIAPIFWTCGGAEEPFQFFYPNGDTLYLNQGNTYIAIGQPETPVIWTAE